MSFYKTCSHEQFTAQFCCVRSAVNYTHHDYYILFLRGCEEIINEITDTCIYFKCFFIFCPEAKYFADKSLNLFFLLSDVGSVEGLAYHRAWDTLYWTSSTTSSITRHTVDQTRPGAFDREAVITMSEDDHPHVLALDECQK